MLTCKQVSKALAEQDYETLPWRRKIALRLHVALCFVCGRYNRQMMDLHDGIRGYRAYEDAAPPRRNGAGLSEDQRRKLRASLEVRSAS